MAFLKGALIGNAAQVLWDTDRSTTNFFKKLVAVLKSRYSGERQADKYRAELQIRRSNISSTCPDNMVNFGPLTAEIVSLVWGTPTISTGFASWQRYCTASSSGRHLNFAAPPVFGRATIRLGIGRHSSWRLFLVLHLRRAACSTFQTCILNSH